MTEPERLVWATAFAQMHYENNTEGTEVQLARAINAAHDAVEGLRHAKGNAELAHRNYTEALAKSHKDQADHPNMPVRALKTYARGNGVGTGIERVHDGAIEMLQSYVDTGEI